MDVLLLWWSVGVLVCFAPKESNPFTSWIEEGLAICGVTIHCVPALHFSARGVFDRNKTLWRGNVIEYPESLVFFAGDTAFGSHFAQIRDKFYAPQLALLPIGAYEPCRLVSLLTKKGDRLPVSSPERVALYHYMDRACAILRVP